MKTIAFIISLSLASIFTNQNNIQISDFEVLEGKWNGELMYINYSDDRPVTLRSTLQIELKKDKLIGQIGYTDEPSVNGKLVVKLKQNGAFINREKVILKSKQNDGSLKIKTRYTGKDNNKPATIFITYIFDANHFTMTKEVQFENSKERFVRNRYTYTR